MLCCGVLSYVVLCSGEGTQLVSWARDVKTTSVNREGENTVWRGPEFCFIRAEIKDML